MKEKDKENIKNKTKLAIEVLTGMQKDSANERDKKIFGMMKSLFEDNREEIIKSNTKHPVIKPSDFNEVDYIQLKNILEEACKEPEYNDNGYSISLPVFYPGKSFFNGAFEMTSAKYSLIKSPLYSRYIDEPAIIYIEDQNRFLLFEPETNEKLAIKTSGVLIYKIKNEYLDDYLLKYIYLMMINNDFKKLQFPEGMNRLNILEGWIPVSNIEDQ
jgi:hypothetical protein